MKSRTTGARRPDTRAPHTRFFGVSTFMPGEWEHPPGILKRTYFFSAVGGAGFFFSITSSMRPYCLASSPLMKKSRSQSCSMRS